MLRTRTQPAADWSRLMFDASQLWADAGMVVALRSWRMMAGGPGAGREVERMLSEKVEAGFELAGALAGGRVTVPRRRGAQGDERLRQARARQSQAPRLSLDQPQPRQRLEGSTD